MAYFLIPHLVFFLHVTGSLSKVHPKTPPIDQRIEFLKYQINEQVKTLRNQHKAKHIGPRADPKFFFLDDEEPKLLNANYDYVDLSRLPITPINENDDRKEHDRFKLRQLRTTTTTTKKETPHTPRIIRVHDPNEFAQGTTPALPTHPTIYNPLSDTNVAKVHAPQNVKLHSQKQSHKKKKHKRKGPAGLARAKEATSQRPVNIFYKQRRLLPPAMRDTPLQWTHCMDLISPFLNGVKNDLNAPKSVGPNHRIVLRLINLMESNVTVYSNQDIYSLMYQISNLQIRLFQWHPDAIRLLYNVLCRNTRHSFKSLKHGIKKLFSVWHLDLSNITNLLAQSRIFRPACINLRENDGSTKSSKHTVFTKSVKRQRVGKKLEDCDDETDSESK